jgi:hypothetical protein
MPGNFLTFQKFNDPQLAATMCELLLAQGIDCKIVNEAPTFDVSFANNKFEPTIHLKVPSGEFVRAHAALEDYYRQQLDTLDPDYYLLSFSDVELLDIVQHPDEWGALDYALAKQLLAKHGKPVTVQQVNTIREQRLEQLSQTEPAHPQWIVFAYLLAVVFGLVGFFLGYALAFSKRNLPNGEQAFIYSPVARRHGRRVMLIAVLWFCYVLWGILSTPPTFTPWLRS